MPVNNETINKNLYDVLSSRGYDPIPLDSKGDPTDEIELADVFRFTYKDIDRRKKGQAWATTEGNELVLYIDDAFTENPEFESFTQFMKRWSQKRLLGFKITNKDHLINDMKKRTVMKKKEDLSEGYYPLNKKSSYSDSVPTVKMVIQHTRQIEEGEQRFRNVDKIFVENANGERFLVPTNRPGLARIYARHIAEGGTPYDDNGKHITSLIEEYTKMAGFVRATRNGQFNESALKLVNEGLLHYNNLRMTLQGMTGHRGYNKYFESYTPMLNEETDDTTTINELFVQEKLDPRIESVLPILNRLNKNITEMSEVKELEEWASDVTGEQIEEGLTDRIRAWNYDRLAKRSGKKASDALDKALEFPFDDLDNREKHEQEFVRQWDIKKQRQEKADSLKDNEVEEGKWDVPDWDLDFGPTMDTRDRIQDLRAKRKAAMQKAKQAIDLDALKDKAGRQQAGSATAKYYKDKVAKAENPSDKEVPYSLKEESDSERPYVCVHAKKGKHECTAKTSYEAAKKAAQYWKLKSTAGIDAYLADVKHVATNEGKTYKDAKLNAPRSPVAKNAPKSGAGAHKDKSKVIPRKEKYKNTDIVESSSNLKAKALAEKIWKKYTSPKNSDRLDSNPALISKLIDAIAGQRTYYSTSELEKIPGVKAIITSIDNSSPHNKAKFDKGLEVLSRHISKKFKLSEEGSEKGLSIEDMVIDQYNNGNEVWEIANYLGMSEDEVRDIIQGIEEDLDANQKRVGQLGPTEKVKNNNIGKLVGANESTELAAIKKLSGLK